MASTNAHNLKRRTRKRRTLHRVRSSAVCLHFDMSACLPSNDASTRLREPPLSYLAKTRPPSVRPQICVSSRRRLCSCYAHASLRHSMDRPTAATDRGARQHARPVMGVSVRYASRHLRHHLGLLLGTDEGESEGGRPRPPLDWALCVHASSLYLQETSALLCSLVSYGSRHVLMRCVALKLCIFWPPCIIFG